MLTDKQRHVLSEALRAHAKVAKDSDRVDEVAFAAGIAWGAADMRERAAKVAATRFARIHTYASENSDRYIAMRDAGELIERDIRALPGEAP